MIKISYLINSIEEIKEFPHTPNGHVESIKFLEKLRIEYQSHPYWHLLPKIQINEWKLLKVGSDYNKRMYYRNILNKLNRERDSYLKHNKIDHPGSLNVKIETI